MQMHKYTLPVSNNPQTMLAPSSDLRVCQPMSLVKQASFDAMRAVSNPLLLANGACSNSSLEQSWQTIPLAT